MGMQAADIDLASTKNIPTGLLFPPSAPSKDRNVFSVRPGGSRNDNGKEHRIPTEAVVAVTGKPRNRHQRRLLIKKAIQEISKKYPGYEKVFDMSQGFQFYRRPNGKWAALLSFRKDFLEEVVQIWGSVVVSQVSRIHVLFSHRLRNSASQPPNPAFLLSHQTRTSEWLIKHWFCWLMIDGDD